MTADIDDKNAEQSREPVFVDCLSVEGEQFQFEECNWFLDSGLDEEHILGEPDALSLDLRKARVLEFVVPAQFRAKLIGRSTPSEGKAKLIEFRRPESFR